MKAILFGAGSIGGYKPDHIDNENTGCLTHAHAIAKYMEPLAVVDPDGKKCSYVKNKWGFKRAVGSYQVLAQSQIEEADLFVIATPPSTHRELVRFLASMGAAGKTILIEKPCGVSARDAYEIDKICTKAGIKTFVNYQRCYLRAYDMAEIRKQIGSVESIVLHYCRGWKRDACHFFALLDWWGWDIGALAKTEGGYTDFSEDDRTFSAMDYFGGLHIIAHDGRDADVFQIEIYGKEGRAVFEQHGKLLSYYHHEKEQTFGEYQSWSSVPAVTIPTGLEDGLSAVYDTILGTKRGGWIDARNAMEIHEMMEAK